MSVTDVGAPVRTDQVSVGVSDCSPLVTDALVSALRETGLTPRTLDCSGDLGDSDALRETDVVLADARLSPGELERLAAAVAAQPSCSLVLLCPQVTKAVVQAMRALGAVAAFERTRSVQELAGVIRRVADGDVLADDRAVDGAGPTALTSRELEILEIIANGATNDDVAVTLGISPHTVRSHLGNILGKLGVTGRVGAVAAVRQAGLLPAPRSLRR
jgi:DNA-binding NarL/FixJ family response regulator